MVSCHCSTRKYTVLCVLSHVGTVVFLLLSMLVPAWVVTTTDDGEGVVSIKLGIWRVCLEGECRSVYHDDSEVVQTLGGWFPVCQAISVLQMVTLGISLGFAMLWFKHRNLQACMMTGVLMFVTCVHSTVILFMFLVNGHHLHAGTDEDSVLHTGVAAYYQSTGIILCVIAMCAYLRAYRWHEDVVIWRGYTRI